MVNENKIPGTVEAFVEDAVEVELSKFLQEKYQDTNYEFNGERVLLMNKVKKELVKLFDLEDDAVEMLLSDKGFPVIGGGRMSSVINAAVVVKTDYCSTMDAVKFAEIVAQTDGIEFMVMNDGTVHIALQIKNVAVAQS